MTVFLLATFFAAAQPVAADAPRSFSMLRHNTPGTAFIKAGPMVMALPSSLPVRRTAQPFAMKGARANPGPDRLGFG